MQRRENSDFRPKATTPGAAPYRADCTRVVRCRAYAKVNLCLAVSPPEPAGGPRAGWHRIASWFHAVDLWDDIEIEAVGQDSGLASCARTWAPDAPRPTPIDWHEERDLAVRAHRLMEALAARTLPVRLRVVKRIPTGGGLGGGSSDAAAVMMALDRMFHLGLGVEELRRASARLGSDVAYFITDRPPDQPPPPALVSGFGDRIESAAGLSGPLILIAPEFGCATPAVYRAFDELPSRAFREHDVARLARNGAPEARTLDDALFNDLLPPAERVEPRLGTVRSALVFQGVTPHLSGSGSTMFVLGDRALGVPAGCAVIRTRLVSPASG